MFPERQLSSLHEGKPSRRTRDDDFYVVPAEVLPSVHCHRRLFVARSVYSNVYLLKSRRDAPTINAKNKSCRDRFRVLACVYRFEFGVVDVEVERVRHNFPAVHEVGDEARCWRHLPRHGDAERALLRAHLQRRTNQDAAGTHDLQQTFSNC